MKIIHCADIHLDSSLSAHLDERRAKMRREEILNTFLKMIDYAAAHEVQAILIAGDLFDVRRVQAGVRAAVESAIRRHPDIGFYLLRGNHEASGFLDALEEIPENLKLFGEEWTTYCLNPSGKGNIMLTGAELAPGRTKELYDSLLPDYEKFNIVMLHGQQNDYLSKNRAEVIALEKLKNKGIDYLALGHVHEYHCEELDRRGKWCYSGCLEGRGFDECGEHGFALLEVDEESLSYRHRFIPFASRTLRTLEVDVTGCADSAETEDAVERALAEASFSPEDMVKIVLTGHVDVTVEKNADLLCRRLEDQFFFLKIYDETKFLVDYDSFLLDVSLKGEFVRQVRASELDEETKVTVIRYGLQALAGEVME